MTEIFPTTNHNESEKDPTIRGNRQNEAKNGLSKIDTQKQPEFKSDEEYVDIKSEIPTISLDEIINDIEDDTDRTRTKNFLTGLIKGLNVKNETSSADKEFNTIDQRVLKVLGSSKSLTQINSNELALRTKRARIEDHIKQAPKANENSNFYRNILKPHLDTKNLNEYQQNLYLNAEIVQAFEGFTNNTYIKENFLKFVRESNPTASEEEAIQAMKEFLTSDMFEETLVQMFNRQVDNKDKGVAYFQENMYYRAKVRQQYIKIEKSDLTQEDIEKNKRDIFNATIFLRQKTNIINETKGKSNQERTAKVRELLNKEIPNDPNHKKYIDLMTQSSTISFMQETLISGIRTKEKIGGKIDFNPETKDHDITDIQLYRHLANYNANPSHPLSLTIESGIRDTNIMNALQALGIGGDEIASKKDNSILQQQMLAQQRKIEAENAKKLATEHQRASNYRKEHENRKYNAGAEKTNTPSTTAQKTLANSKGKDLVDGNPSIMGYINERQQEETMNNELLNRRKKTEKIKAIQEYVTSKIGIPYQELDQQYFHEGILINPTELANLLSERKQISLEEATRLTEEIKNFNPNVDKKIERKSMNYMNTNKEIRLFALGQVIDFVKENLNITTEGQQNFAKDFILDHNDALKIKNEKLIIKGTLKGTPVNFYYNLKTGKLSTTPIIAKKDKVYYFHNEHHTREDNDQFNISLAKLPPFDNLVEKGGYALATNKEAFQKAQERKGYDKWKQMRSIFNETLDNTKLLNDFSNHTEQFTQQIEKNQFMQSCLDTFQLKFDNNVVEEVKQPKTFHLLELLEQSINSKEDAIKGKQCLQLLAQLINVHKKLEHIEQQEHQHSEAELTEKGDIQPNSNKKQDFILENTFSETSMKNAKSRAVSLETYLSAYSNGIGKEEKINFTKLYDDLSKIAEGKSYKPTNKMITQLIEPKIERYPHTEEQNKEIDRYFRRKIENVA